MRRARRRWSSSPAVQPRRSPVAPVAGNEKYFDRGRIAGGVKQTPTTEEVDNVSASQRRQSPPPDPKRPSISHDNRHYPYNFSAQSTRNSQGPVMGTDAGLANQVSARQSLCPRSTRVLSERITRREFSGMRNQFHRHRHDHCRSSSAAGDGQGRRSPGGHTHRGHSRGDIAAPSHELTGKAAGGRRAQWCV
jgi:hypothetical protein